MIDFLVTVSFIVKLSFNLYQHLQGKTKWIALSVLEKIKFAIIMSISV